MMKFRMLSAAAAAALVSLAACGGDDEGDEMMGDTTAIETAVPVTPPAVDTGMLAPMPMDSMAHDTMSGMTHDTAAPM